MTPGWRILLDGIGLPWRGLHTVGAPTPEGWSAVIVNRRLWPEEEEAVLAYAHAGGAVLDCGYLLPHRFPWRYRAGWTTSLFPDQSTPLGAALPVIDLHCRTTHALRGGELNGLVTIEPHGAGVIVGLGLDPGPLLGSTRAVTKRFPERYGRHPAERVARVGKGEIMTLLHRLLRRLHHERGLPLLRKRPFPGDATAIFALRIDSDYGTIGQVETLIDISMARDVPITWFLHTEGHAGWLDRFLQAGACELALHCARHRTFPDRDRNLQNMRRARQQMRAAGLPEPIGFAAPTGAWNHGLAEAIDAERFLYSSEFAYAYDALPLRPIMPIGRRVNEPFYRALQIPIHPVSVGNLARVGLDEKEMIEYYAGVIRRKRFLGEPVLLYHHPTHERWRVVEEMIAHGMDQGDGEVAALTFGEYASFWNRREEAVVEGIVTGDVADGTITITSRDRDPRVLIDLELPDGTIASTWRDGEHAIAEMTRRGSPPLPDPNDDLDTLRRFSPMMTKRAVQDAIVKARR